MHRFLVGGQIHQQPRASPCLRKQPLSASAPWHRSPGTGTRAPASPHPGPRRGRLPPGTSRPRPASWRPLRAVTSAAGAEPRPMAAPGRGRAVAMATSPGAAILLLTPLSPWRRRALRPCNPQSGIALHTTWVPLMLAALPAPKRNNSCTHRALNSCSTQRAGSRDEAESITCKKKKLPKPCSRMEKFIVSHRSINRKKETNLKPEMLHVAALSFSG